MPVYDYRCAGCGKKFSVPMTIAEYEKKKVRCPKCGKAKVRQLYGTFFAKTSRKS
jgi:putative FmdB family regulatory protein